MSYNVDENSLFLLAAQEDMRRIKKERDSWGNAGARLEMKDGYISSNILKTKGMNKNGYKVTRLHGQIKHTANYKIARCTTKQS